MESATLDRLMTRETVAGERSRCSASFFRLIGLRAACPAPSLAGLALLDLDFFAATGAQSRTAVSHKEIAGASGDIDPAGLLLFCLLFSPISSLQPFLLLTSAAKAYFIQTVDTLLTRFS